MGFLSPTTDLPVIHHFPRNLLPHTNQHIANDFQEYGSFIAKLSEKTNKTIAKRNIIINFASKM